MFAENLLFTTVLERFTVFYVKTLTSVKMLSFKLEFVYLLLFDELYKLPNATDIAAQQIDIPALCILQYNPKVICTFLTVYQVIIPTL